jgi:GT2 family glycosyltransferase
LHRTAVRADYELGYVSGGLLLTRPETLRAVGLLDEYFFLYAEDRDWGLRLEHAGYRNSYAVDAEVWHKGSLTVVPRSPFQDYHVVRAQLQFVRKHTPWLLPFALIHSLVRSLAPKIARLQWERGKAVLRAYTDFVSLRASPSRNHSY